MAEKPDKLEEEIEELLRQMPEFVPEKPIRFRRRRHRIRLPGAERYLWRLRRLGPGELMLVSFGLFLLALLLFGVSSALGTVMALISGGLFFYAFAASFGRTRSAGYQKRWRGRVVELPPQRRWRWGLLWHRLRWRLRRRR